MKSYTYRVFFSTGAPLKITSIILRGGSQFHLESIQAVVTAAEQIKSINEKLAAGLSCRLNE